MLLIFQFQHINFSSRVFLLTEFSVILPVTPDIFILQRYYIVLSDGEIEIQSGEHKFPFTYTLSPNLPSSFEGIYGYVRYTITATLDRPWKFDHEVKTPFTVISSLDLNQEPKAQVCIKVAYV